MSDIEIRIVDHASTEDSDALRDALHAFNYDATGYRDGRSLSCFVRGEHGQLLAGIDGFTWGGYARVDSLWVDASLRGQGLGRKLLEAAEREAARRGCRTIVLDTHEFQAPGLYRKCGYAERGYTDDTPIGARQFFFQKALPPEVGAAPASD